MANWKQNRLGDLAKTAGGGAIYLFSQGQRLRYGAETGPDQGKLYKKVKRGSGVMGGACYAISAFWVIFHATQGSDNPFTKDRTIWEYLFDQGGLNLGAASNIVVEHRESSRIGQTLYFDQQLGKFGLVRRKEIVSGQDLEVSGSASHIGTLQGKGRAIANAIVQQGEGYRTISLRRAEGGGHAVAGWVGQDVSFMDPNFGEFWFPNHQSFIGWFEAFWGLVQYPYTEIVVRTYAAKIV
jgi:YopT peptidase